MLFRVKNLGLIDEAEIKLDGITVITGENNVGKSMIGRMLYCVNNVFLPGRIEAVKIGRIKRVILNNILSGELESYWVAGSAEQKIQESSLLPSLLNENVRSDAIQKVLQEILGHSNEELIVDQNFFDEIGKKIQDILSMPDSEILADLLNIAVGKNFSGITHNTYTDNRTTEIEVIANEKETIMTITGDDVNVEGFENVIFQEAIYIESPRVAQDSEKKSLNPVFDSRQRVLQMLTEDSDADFWEQKEMAAELKDILDKVSALAPGNLVKQNSYSNKLEYEEEGRRFDLINVSSGVKTFAILKKLLNNAKLKRNGMLILDEPEIHLHPDWSTIFAEVLVLLQKQFNLRVLINTHSGDFLMALEEYSKLHKIEENCNYYLIKRYGYHSTCEDCTDSLNKIYQHFANFYDDLDNLRYDEFQKRFVNKWEQTNGPGGVS